MALVDIHPSVRIDPSARIDVRDRLVIGAGGVIGENCEISGRDVEIGRDLWMDRGSRIGGGSCFEVQSIFSAGHFLHLGQDVFVNTARPVIVGDEVGLGTRTAIYTHGAYLSALEGFPVAYAPVTIGDRVWMPGAIVNPGVTVGDDVVIGVNSLVTRDIPSGSLAAGSPAKVIRENAYPKQLDDVELEFFWGSFWAGYPEPLVIPDRVGDHLTMGDTIFDLAARMISGPVTTETEQLRNQLRRYGIRFRSSPDGGTYESW